MRIEHLRPTGQVSNEISSQVAIFLRSQAGWFSQYTTRQSRYEGLYLADYSTQPNRFFKLVERIDVLDGEGNTLPPQTVRVGEASTQYVYPNTTATLQIPGSGCALRYLCSVPANIQISLDMREIYSQPEDERSYSVEHYGDGLLLSYTDPFLASRTLYLHVRGLDESYCRKLASLSNPGQWKEAAYPRDAARNSFPDKLYVYTLPSAHTQSLAFGGAWTREEAAAASWAAWSQPNIEPGFSVLNGSPTDIARSAVEQSLWWLKTEAGYYAGYPWFHQIWTRDELLTGLGLPREEQLQMIRRYLSLPVTHGELPTFAGSGTTCADGLGWLALLLREYGLENLEGSDRDSAHSLFLEAVAQLRAERLSPTGLVYSGWNATWMDTIGRAGYRIEIQAMYALVLQLLSELSSTEDEAEAWSKEWQESSEMIAHRFYQDGYLIDGFEENQEADRKKRPNVFLTYLLQPNLLSQEQWEPCFSTVLSSCKTGWGGLTSLEVDEPAFQATSTGQDNRSYHNGDSWFFVNNLTALALQRCNPELFAEQIRQIMAASTEEVLWKNILGCPGEIASASDGASWGCGVQGFSGGAYLAALRETSPIS